MGQRPMNIMSTQNAQWVSYLKQKNNQSYIAGLDLSLAPQKIGFKYPFVIKITIHANSENVQENGFPNEEELDKLQADEDVMISIAERLKNLIFCGWRTGDGKRELFFYVTNAKQFIKKMETALKKKPKVKAEIMAEKDEKWTVYMEELYPSEMELEEINKQLNSEEEE